MAEVGATEVIERGMEYVQSVKKKDPRAILSCWSIIYLFYCFDC